MPVYIQTIETQVPETEYTQEFIRGLMEKSIRASGKTARYLQRLYRHSGIETRHSVIRDLAGTADEECLAMLACRAMAESRTPTRSAPRPRKRSDAAKRRPVSPIPRRLHRVRRSSQDTDTIRARCGTRSGPGRDREAYFLSLLSFLGFLVSFLRAVFPLAMIAS